MTEKVCRARHAYAWVWPTILSCLLVVGGGVIGYAIRYAGEARASADTARATAVEAATLAREAATLAASIADKQNAVAEAHWGEVQRRLTAIEGDVKQLVRKAPLADVTNEE